jgi:hypothetical protein
MCGLSFNTCGKEKKREKTMRAGHKNTHTLKIDEANAVRHISERL